MARQSFVSLSSPQAISFLRLQENSSPTLEVKTTIRDEQRTQGTIVVIAVVDDDEESSIFASFDDGTVDRRPSWRRCIYDSFVTA